MRPLHVVCLLAAVAAAASAAVGGPDPVALHLSRVVQFRCSEPQDRAVPAVEVVQRRINTNQTLWPPVTVLRKCDSGSGCCLGNGFTCTPIDFQNVTLFFMLQTPPGPDGTKQKGEVIDVVVQEHKTCACRQAAEGDAH